MLYLFFHYLSFHHHLGEIYLSHDPLGRLFVLVLLPHVLQSRVVAAQFSLDFL